MMFLPPGSTVELADGADGAAADLARGALDAERPLGGGEQRVVAQIHRRRAGVVGVAEEGDAALHQAGDRRDRADRQRRPPRARRPARRAARRRRGSRPLRPCAGDRPRPRRRRWRARRDRRRRRDRRARSTLSTETWPDTAADPIVPRRKREPSSPTKTMTSSGRRVSTRATSSASSAHTAPTTPSGPSSLPPDGTESRCEPVITTGSRESHVLPSRSRRRARKLPTSSWRTSRPAARMRSAT